MLETVVERINMATALYLQADYFSHGESKISELVGSSIRTCLTKF